MPKIDDRAKSHAVAWFFCIRIRKFYSKNRGSSKDVFECFWDLNCYPKLGITVPIPYPPLHNKCRCTIKTMSAVRVGDATKDGQNGADWYLKNFGILPNYYIDEIGLIKLGWRNGDKPSKYAPGKMFTKGIYDNSDGHLPKKPGLMFVTYDHYMTFYEIV